MALATIRTRQVRTHASFRTKLKQVWEGKVRQVAGG